MRKTFLQLYNEIFENKDLRTLRNRIILALDNIYNSLPQENIKSYISVNIAGIDDSFDGFFKKRLSLYSLIENIMGNFRAIHDRLIEDNFNTEANSINDLAAEITNLITPIGIANDIIQDKVRDKTFTTNTVSYISYLLYLQTRIMLGYCSYERTTENQMLKFRNIFFDLSNRPNLTQFRNSVNRLKIFLEDNIEDIIENNTRYSNARIVINNTYQQIQDIISQINF